MATKPTPLRSKRLDLGLTLRDVATATGYSIGSISRWERDPLSMQVRQALTFSQHYNTPLHQLIPDLQASNQANKRKNT